MRVCIFADGCDRAAAQQLLATLPRDTYGHVFIAADAVDAQGRSLPDDGPLASGPAVNEPVLGTSVDDLGDTSVHALVDAMVDEVAVGVVAAPAKGACADLAAPERVQVSWLSSRGGPCPLAEAMSGWAAEWLPGEGCAEDAPTVWLLPGASTRLSGGDHDCVTRLITALPSDQLIHG